MLEIKNPSKWHKYFLRMTRFVAEQTQDTSTKCGCVIVRGNRVLSTGYNGFPAGTEDYDNPKKNGPDSRPEKYYWFEHGERNAIYGAAKCGVSLDGATAYITGSPCADCTRGLIQSGIIEIIIPRKPNTLARPDAIWHEHVARSREMLQNAGVNIFYVEIDDGE